MCSANLAGAFPTPCRIGSQERKQAYAALNKLSMKYRICPQINRFRRKKGAKASAMITFYRLASGHGNYTHPRLPLRHYGRLA
jgi:hypothetical protein